MTQFLGSVSQRLRLEPLNLAGRMARWGGGDVRPGARPPVPWGGPGELAVRFYLADAFRSIVNRISCWLSVLRALGVLSSVFLSSFASFASPLPQRLLPLQEELKRQGFAIIFMHPANKYAYGTYDAKEKRLTISPLAFELGIGEQVFVHEAVHAAQSCPSGTLSPLGWSFPVPRVVQNEISGVLYNAYRHKNKALEREAFMAQSRPDAVPMLISALRTRCR